MTTETTDPLVCRHVVQGGGRGCSCAEYERELAGARAECARLRERVGALRVALMADVCTGGMLDTHTCRYLSCRRAREALERDVEPA